MFAAANWYLIVFLVASPSQQIGPYFSKAACEAALKVTMAQVPDYKEVYGVCIPVPTEGD